MNFRAAALALGLIAFTPAANAAAGAGIDDATGLVVGPGWELVRSHCTPCHAATLITAQRASRARWLEIIRWMQETQNLWSIEPEPLDRILDYLSTYYSPRDTYSRRAPLPPHLSPPPAGGDQTLQ